MNDELEESGMWISDDKRPMHLSREQLKVLRAGLFESAERAREFGLEIEIWLAEALGVGKSLYEPEEETWDEEEDEEETKEES
jgi:hypothetical protein